MNYSEDLVRLALKRIAEKYDIDDATALDAGTLKVTCDDRGFDFCAITTKPVATNYSRGVANFVSAGHSFSSFVAKDDPTYEVYRAVFAPSTKGVEPNTTAEGLPEPRKRAAIIPKTYDGTAHLLLVRFAEQKKVTIDELDATTLMVSLVQDNSTMLSLDDYIQKNHPDYHDIKWRADHFFDFSYRSKDPKDYGKFKKMIWDWDDEYEHYRRNFTSIPTLKVKVRTNDGASLEMSIPDTDPDFGIFSKLVHSVGFHEFKNFVNSRNAPKPVRLRDLFRKPVST